MSGNVFVSPFNPVQQMGVRAHNPPDLIIANRAPMPSDWDYFLGTLWLYQGNSLWTIASKVVSLTVKTGDWIQLTAGAGVLNTLKGDDGAIVNPVAGNISITGLPLIPGPDQGIEFYSIGAPAGNLRAKVLVDGTSIAIDPFSGDLYTPNLLFDNTTTVGAVPQNLFALPLGAAPGVYTFEIAIAGISTAGVGSPLGVGFTLVGSVRTTGAGAVLLSGQAVDNFWEGALAPATATLGVAGNNAVVTLSGVAGYTIDWKSRSSWIVAS